MAVQKKADTAEPSLKSTKQELLDAYTEMRQQLLEKDKTQLKPEQKVQEFPKRLDAAVAAAVKETTERMGREAKYQQDLLQKDFEGQKNVLTARIQSLEKAVKEQAEQLAKLSQQQEAAYQKIHDVAVKAIEGASKLGSFGSLVHTLKEQTRKQTGEE